MRVSEHIGDNRRDQSEATAPADTINVDSPTWQRQHAETMRKKEEMRQARLAAYIAQLRGNKPGVAFYDGSSATTAPKK